MGGGAKDAPDGAGLIVLNGILMHWNVALRFGPLERCIIPRPTTASTTPSKSGTTTENFSVFRSSYGIIRCLGTRYVPRPGEYPLKPASPN